MLFCSALYSMTRAGLQGKSTRPRDTPTAMRSWSVKCQQTICTYQACIWSRIVGRPIYSKVRNTPTIPSLTQNRTIELRSPRNEYDVMYTRGGGTMLQKTVVLIMDQWIGTSCSIICHWNVIIFSKVGATEEAKSRPVARGGSGGSIEPPK